AGSAGPVFPVPVLALGDLRDNRLDPPRACLLTPGLEHPFDIVAPLARRKSLPMPRSRRAGLEGCAEILWQVERRLRRPPRPPALALARERGRLCDHGREHLIIGKVGKR